MPKFTRFFRRGAVLVAALTVTSIPGAPTAGAVDGLPIRCTASGTVQPVEDALTGIVTWTITGKGMCTGDFEGTYFVDFTGTGTSNGMGACSGDPAAANLSIVVTGTLFSFGTGLTRPLLQTWENPSASYPVVTPFTLANGGGGGAFYNRIFGECPPGGSPAATFDWFWNLAGS